MIRTAAGGAALPILEAGRYFFFLPRSGITVVIGAVNPPSETGFGAPVSFFGFLASLLLRCCPLAI